MALVGEYLKNLAPYKAGKPIAETKRELGLSGEVIKLASNENCYGPSPKVVAALHENLAALQLYPDSAAWQLKQGLLALYESYHLTVDQLVLGNGTDELINMVIRTFMLPGETAINCSPTFSAYHIKLQALGRQEQCVPMKADLTVAVEDILAAVTPQTKLVFLANPNNPSGTIITTAALEHLLEKLPERVLVFLDEAYAEYVDNADFPDSYRFLDKYRNLIVSRTFSKIYGLAGLRVGYAFCHPEVAGYLNVARDPFNVNALGQLAAGVALTDQEHLRRCRQQNRQEREWLAEKYRELGLFFWPGQANFMLVDFQKNAEQIFTRLLYKGLIVRPQSDTLATCARITVGTHEQNIRLLAALGEVLHEG